MGWKERTLSSCSFLVSQGASSSSGWKGSWVVTSDGLLSSSSSFSRSAGAWRSFQTTQEVAAAAEKQQPMGGDHTKGHGNKKKMNLFSAINNALYTALDTDPRSTWSSSLANFLPAYLVGCCGFHSFVMLWISGVFFFLISSTIFWIWYIHTKRMWSVMMMVSFTQLLELCSCWVSLKGDRCMFLF